MWVRVPEFQPVPASYGTGKHLKGRLSSRVRIKRIHCSRPELLAKVGPERVKKTAILVSSVRRSAAACIISVRWRCPDVILFDEPTSALDPELVGEVLNTICQLAQEKRTMVIVTHEMSFTGDRGPRDFYGPGVSVEQGEAKALFANPQRAAHLSSLKISDAVILLFRGGCQPLWRVRIWLRPDHRCSRQL